jgi:hypothetical protein
MTIHLTDHRGYNFNTQSDVLNITGITMTDTLDLLTVTDYEINPQSGFPFTDIADTAMIRIETVQYFSNRVFRIGDRILIRGHTRGAATNSVAFTDFINRVDGHIIVNLDVQEDAATENKSYMQNIYIAPPGTFNVTTGVVDNYIATDLGTTTAGGVLINSDLQCNIFFRIITRSVDTLASTMPLNIGATV